ncbi:group 1 glycosyl transferase [Candidatus Protofrankia californiensis]|uniref:Group 1 glycosyl transferase n=1 Tax=Candidatus Protofrankia californiensis TaxID=1839754 RepID=A0A1C3NVY3_9ACTN|nr:group 1 glycosyl transferase [Candidatus Protofrankia californiensis]
MGDPETEPFPATSYPLSWRRPDSWLRLGRRLRADVDAVVIVMVTPVQAPAYLGVLAGLRPAENSVAGLRPADPRPESTPAGPRPAGNGLAGLRPGDVPAGPRPAEDSPAARGSRGAPAVRASGDGPVALALCHNVLPHERRALDEPLVRAVLRRVSGVLVHTQAEAERARRLTARPVSVAPMAPHLWTTGGGAVAGSGGSPAVDLPVLESNPLKPNPLKPNAGRHRDGVPGRRLLFFGLVRPYKGLDVLLRALAAGPPDVHLTVAGEFWGGVGDTRRMIDELGLAGRVDLRPGYVPAADVPALFAAADAVVLPYRSATATQNVDLAHRYGLPVVATAVGMLAQAVRDGVDGLLATPGDPMSLAAALHRLYEPGMLDALRAAVVPPDVDAAWDRYLTVLCDALGRL